MANSAFQQSSAGAAAVLNVTGTADRITVTGGQEKVVDIANTYAGQASINTLGTIVTGTWEGDIVGGEFGGTGVNNGADTITTQGNVILPPGTVSSVLLASVTANLAAVVDFTGLSTDYFSYQLACSNVIPQTNGQKLCFRTSTNNGVSYDSAANYYASALLNRQTSDTLVLIRNSAGLTEGNMSGNMSSGGAGNNFNIWLTNIASNLAQNVISWQGGYFDVDYGNCNVSGSGFNVNTQAVNAIRLLTSSGNISGTFKLYGLRAA